MLFSYPLSSILRYASLAAFCVSVARVVKYLARVSRRAGASLTCGVPHKSLPIPENAPDEGEYVCGAAWNSPLRPVPMLTRHSILEAGNLRELVDRFHHGIVAPRSASVRELEVRAESEWLKVDQSCRSGTGSLPKFPLMAKGNRCY